MFDSVILSIVVGGLALLGIGFMGYAVWRGKQLEREEAIDRWLEQPDRHDME